jgi:hypothetical protein
MTLTKYATLSVATLALLLVFGFNSDTFAQNSRIKNSSFNKIGRKDINGMISPNKSSHKDINSRTQRKASAGRPDNGFAIASSSTTTRFNSGIVRARIVQSIHSQEKELTSTTNLRNSETFQITSSGLRPRLVNSDRLSESAKKLENNKAEAKRTEKGIKSRTNIGQKTS